MVALDEAEVMVLLVTYWVLDAMLKFGSESVV